MSPSAVFTAPVQVAPFKVPEEVWRAFTSFNSPETRETDWYWGLLDPMKKETVYSFPGSSPDRDTRAVAVAPGVPLALSRPLVLNASQ